MRTSVTLILTLTFLFSEGHAETCKDVGSISKQASQLGEISNKVEVAPFLSVCKDPKLLNDRPKNNYFLRDVVLQDSQGHKTELLLRKVVEKVQMHHIEMQITISQIRSCTSSKVDRPDCHAVKNWTSETLPELVHQSRYDLSLSQGANDLDTWMGKTSKDVNSNLKPLGSYKNIDWSPLTSQEKSLAEKRLQEYQTDIHNEALSRVKKGQLSDREAADFEEKTLFAVRYRHFMRYHQTLAENPLLQFLSGPQVTLGDISKALDQAENAMEEEEKWIEKWDKMLSQRPIPSDVLNLLSYNSFLEASLAEDESYCGLATTLEYARNTLDITKSMMLGLPTMLISFVAPPVGGALATMAGSALLTGDSYGKMDHMKMRYLTSSNGGGEGNLRELEDASRELKVDVVTLPIGYGLGGQIAKRALRLGPGSWAFAGKILKLRKY